MKKFDGSHLKIENGMSETFVQNAANLVEHCRLVSLEKYRDAKAELESADEKFAVAGDSFIVPKDSILPARAYVAYNKRDVVIAFRGSGVDEEGGFISDKTKTLINALTDARVRLQKEKNFPGKIHTGFISEYRELAAEIKSRLRETGFKEKNLYITGFSLGGALAALCAWDIFKTYKIKPQAYFFAAPACGNRDFTAEFEKNISHVFRIAHEDDAVSQIPHGIFCVYRETGKNLLVFNDDGEQVSHKKIKLVIKADWLAAIAKVFPPGTVGLAIAIALAKLLITFATVHKPEVYKKKLAKMFLNFKKSAEGGASLRKTASAHREECSKHCLGL